MRQKTLLFIAALLVIGQSVCAREYLPMLKEGKQWMYYYTNQHYECNYYFTLNGDTVIDGKTWHKVYERMVDQWTGTDIIRERYAGAMFEEDGRVYRFTKNVQKKEMLCDFNLEVGDKTSEGNWEVTDIGNTYAFGKTRKCLTLRRVNEDPYLHHVEYWIEGIGSSNTFVDSSISFLACYEDNRCVFTNANFTDMPDAKVTPEHDQLISEGRQWWYKNYDTNISVDGVDSRMVMKGDTTIAGNTWKKLYYIETPGSVPVYRKALREDGSRVYELPAGGQERLLLDFTLGIGDRYSPDGSEDRYLEVVGVDTVLSAGIARRRLILQQYVNNIETNLSTWTEGVGSECGIDQPASWSDWGVLYQNGHHTFNYYLLSFSGCADKNGNCIYGIIPYNDTYRPFIEEGKVWKVGHDELTNPVQLVDYYYFDGDTIIDGKTCKQMICERFVSPDHPNYDWILTLPSLYYEGAWYEEDKKVYTYDETNKQFMLMYDFSLDDNDTIQIKDYQFVVGPKQTGGLKGFKGVYQDLSRCEESGGTSYSPTWMEGVGSIDCPTENVYYVDEAPSRFLMACYAGDEVIYFNDEYEDGATPEITGSRKNRFDFSHTVKTKPKSRTTRGAEPSLYGEYNDQQLGINLNPLYDAYLVSITDETGKTVYEKNINAGAIVGLNIDISAYPEGRYTVTVENNNESFTGEFDAQTAGVGDALRLNDNGKIVNDNIYNLQGQRLSSLQKGLNIVNGQKVFVK